jgi:hypothetical protein
MRNSPHDEHDHDRAPLIRVAFGLLVPLVELRDRLDKKGTIMNLPLLLLCAVAALIFAGIRVGLPALFAGIRAFWVDFWSFGLAILVFASQSIFGLHL